MASIFSNNLPSKTLIITPDLNYFQIGSFRIRRQKVLIKEGQAIQHLAWRNKSPNPSSRLAAGILW